MKAQVDNKTAPAGAGNTNQGPIQNDTSRSEMVIVGTTNPTQNEFDPKHFIIELLKHAANDHSTARDMSAKYVELGRQHGITWDDLAAPLGLKPTTLQMRMHRSGEAIK